MRAALTLLTLVACLVSASGCVCAAIGAGMGAAVPKFDDCRTGSDSIECGSAWRATALESGTPVSVLTTHSGPITGTYLSREEDGLVLAPPDNGPAILVRNVEVVRRRAGNQWETGFGIGALVDIAVGIGVGLFMLEHAPFSAQLY